VNETSREDASPFGVTLHVAFHPILVFCLLDHDYKDLTLAERYLIVIIRFAIVKGPTPSSWTKRKKNGKISNSNEERQSIS
jgi:hypothetical protein